METFQILSDQFSHFQHLFHRWLAIFFIISSYIFDLSSSPHTWGIRICWLSARSQATVHPHLRRAYHWTAVRKMAGFSHFSYNFTRKSYFVHLHIGGAMIEILYCTILYYGPPPVQGYHQFFTILYYFLKYVNLFYRSSTSFPCAVSPTTSIKKLTGRNPSLQDSIADFGFFIHPS